MKINDDEDEFIDPMEVYKLFYGFGYEVDGVSLNDIKLLENGVINKDEADFQFIDVDSDTSENLRKFGLHNITKYAIANDTFFRRRKIIEDADLNKYELLIMILITKCVWGLPGNTNQKKRTDNFRKRKERIKSENEAIQKFSELYILLKKQNTYYETIDPSVIIEKPKITLNKVSFTFTDETNSGERNRTIVYKSEEQSRLNPIMKILLRYVELMRKNTEDFHQDLGIEAYNKEQNDLWLQRNPKKPHFAFCYEFIEFMKSKFAENNKQISDNQLFIIYADLLKEGGFTINTNPKILHSEQSNIKKWYNEIKKKP